MKMLAFLVVIMLQSFALKAQFVFRNAGPDTLRIAIGTFYDSTSKAVKKPALQKAIITRGWYRLYPGDSIVAGELFGPAVFYLIQHIREGRYILGEPVPDPAGNLRENYRERLLTVNVAIKDTAKFSVKHPFGSVCSTRLVEEAFYVVTIPEGARREKRLLIDVDRRRGGG